MYYAQDCQCEDFPHKQALDCHVHMYRPRHFSPVSDLDIDCNCEVVMPDRFDAREEIAFDKIAFHKGFQTRFGKDIHMGEPPYPNTPQYKHKRASWRAGWADADMEIKERLISGDELS